MMPRDGSHTDRREGMTEISLKGACGVCVGGGQMKEGGCARG